MRLRVGARNDRPEIMRLRVGARNDVKELYETKIKNPKL